MSIRKIKMDCIIWKAILLDWVCRNCVAKVAVGDPCFGCAFLLISSVLFRFLGKSIGFPGPCLWPTQRNRSRSIFYHLQNWISTESEGEKHLPVCQRLVLTLTQKKKTNNNGFFSVMCDAIRLLFLSFLRRQKIPTTKTITELLLFDFRKLSRFSISECRWKQQRCYSKQWPCLCRWLCVCIYIAVALCVRSAQRWENAKHMQEYARRTSAGYCQSSRQLTHQKQRDHPDQYTGGCWRSRYVHRNSQFIRAFSILFSSRIGCFSITLIQFGRKITDRKRVFGG